MRTCIAGTHVVQDGQVAEEPQVLERARDTAGSDHEAGRFPVMSLPLNVTEPEAGFGRSR